MKNYIRYPGVHPSLDKYIMEVEKVTTTNTKALKDPYLRRKLQIQRDSVLELKRPKSIVVYKTEFKTPHGVVKARIYEPTDLSQKKASLLYIHGGGWIMGDLNSHDTVCVDLAIISRVKVISIAYALAPEAPYPIALEQCVSIYKSLYEDPARFNLNKSSIAVGGDSAGGNLVLALSLKLRSKNYPLPAINLLIYPCLGLDFDTPSYKKYQKAPILDRKDMIWFWNNYLSNNLNAQDPIATPSLENDLRGLPPTILHTAEIDPLAFESETLAKKLITDGVPLIYRQSKGMVHGFMRFREPKNFAQIEFFKMAKALNYLFYEAE